MKKLSIICLFLAIALTLSGCASEIVFAETTGTGANPLNLREMGLINMDSEYIYYVDSNNSLIKVSHDGTKQSKIGGKCYGFVNVSDEFVFFNGKVGDQSGICRYEKATGSSGLVYLTDIENMLLISDAIYFIDNEASGVLQKYSLDDDEATVVDENGNSTFLDYCFDKLYYSQKTEQGYVIKAIEIPNKPEATAVLEATQDINGELSETEKPIEHFEIKTFSTIFSAPIKVLTKNLVLSQDGYIFEIKSGKRYEKVEKLTFDTINVLGETLIYQNSDGIFKCDIITGNIEKVGEKEFSARLYVIGDKVYFVDAVNIKYYEAKGDSFTPEKMFTD